MPSCYRFTTVSGTGVFEAVQRDCPKEDPRWKVAPDESWHTPIGEPFPGCQSWWTEDGMREYVLSGLQDWHRSVVAEPIQVTVARINNGAKYTDGVQIISEPEHFRPLETLPLDEFIDRLAHDYSKPCVGKVAIYVTRGSGSRAELLVFHHADHPEAGVQVPAGTIEPGESPHEAARRELREEAGIGAIDTLEALGDCRFYKTHSHEFQHRHYFHLPDRSDLPDRWSQRVASGDEDEGLRFNFSWQPLDRLDPMLLRMGGIADSLLRLRRSLR